MSKAEKTKDKEQQTKNKLILALDVDTAEKARAIFSELKGEVGAFKIGLQLFTAAGADFVRELIKRDAKIFLDLKFHDIPHTVANAAVEAVRLGVWMFNVHAAGGREMMERTAAAVRETAVREKLRQPKIIAVTVLTSTNAETLRETGVEDELLPQVLKLAKLTADSNLDGVVASPLEITAIRETVKNREFLIVTPGIRPQIEAEKLPSQIQPDDQKRTSAAGAAIKNGADYLVVGRPVLAAANKIQAVRDILREIESAKRD